MKQKIQIAVAIAPDGEWNAEGGSWIYRIEEAISTALIPLPKDGSRSYIIEAEIEVPDAAGIIVKGTVKDV